MTEYGLTVHALYSTISDRELDDLAEQIKQLWISHDARTLVASRPWDPTCPHQELSS